MPNRNLSNVAEGQRLCAVGYGMSSPVHRHGTVTGITKLYVKVQWRAKTGADIISRYRKQDGREVPQIEWGGVTAYETCQRPADKLRPLQQAAEPKPRA